MRTLPGILIFALLISSVSWCQQNLPTTPAAADPQMDMPGMDMSPKGDAATSTNMHAMHSMEGHMDMGPHMKMTALRPAKPGDSERARQIADAARKASEKYLDYKVALADGFKIFLPHVPQKVYHFTNYKYGREAALAFNPDHPTSLLYEKLGDGYKLVGVMYTAPRRLTEDELNQRIPLSFAQWHQHVNYCLPPLGHRLEMFTAPNSKFGVNTLSTKEACDAIGGTFYPVVLNWMVHVYPFEKEQANIWSVDRDHDGD